MSGRVIQVLLPDELAEEISASVERGEYSDVNEALIGAVEEWSAQRSVEALSVEELRRLWREGIDSGPGQGLTIEEIKEDARRRRDAG